MFTQYVSFLPTRTLEDVLPQTIKLIAEKIRKDRRRKGMVKAVECLARDPLERLDFGGLFGGLWAIFRVKPQNHSATIFEKWGLAQPPTPGSNPPQFEP